MNRVENLSMFLVFCLLMSTMIVVNGLLDDTRVRRVPAPAERQLNFVSQRTLYMRDERTGLCFATYGLEGDHQNTSYSMFTHVPCESVPTNLLK